MKKALVLRKKSEEKGIKPARGEELGFGLARVGDKLVAEYRLPGVEEKDVHFEITHNILKVRAQHKHEMEMQKKGMYKYSKSQSGFYREVTLPEPVDAGKTRSEFKHGVLRIEMPLTNKKDVKRS